MEKKIIEVNPVEVLGSIHIAVDSIKEECLKLKSTSSMIRFLLSKHEGDRSKVVKLLKEYGVTTKEGNEIRYQFVNNVMNQKVK